MAVAPQVVERDRGAAACPRRAASISPRSSRSSRLDERQVEEAVGLGLGREGPELGRRRRPAARRPRRAAGSPSRTGSSRGRGRCRGAGRCAPCDPVKWMRYVPASPGGMIIRSTCGPREQAHRRLVRRRRREPARPTQGREPLDQRGRVVGLGQQVEVADRLAPSAERAGRLDPSHAGRSSTARPGADRRSPRPRPGASARPVLERRDPGQDRLLGLLRHAA